MAEHLVSTEVPESYPVLKEREKGGREGGGMEGGRGEEERKREGEGGEGREGGTNVLASKV